MEMHEPHHVTEIRDGGARASVSRPAPGMVLVKIEGHASPHITDSVLRALDAILRENARPMHLFQDAESTTSIGPGTVAKWSAFLRRNASRVTEMIAFIPSHDRIAAATSIINRLSAGMVTVVRSRADFDHRLRRAKAGFHRSATNLVAL